MEVFLVAASGDGDPISPRVSKALLISCLGEEGQRIYSTLPPAVKREAETDFDVALRQLDTFFEKKTNVIVERFTFRQRGQHQGETTAEYVSVLRGLAKSCAFRDMEDELIRDISCLIRDRIALSAWTRCSLWVRPTRGLSSSPPSCLAVPQTMLQSPRSTTAADPLRSHSV